MKSKATYMKRLKEWLQSTSESPLEEMNDFFTKRLDDYEEHMSVWKKSYHIFAETLPLECRKILDLGCGTGLELDEIWKKKSMHRGDRRGFVPEHVKQIAGKAS